MAVQGFKGCIALCVTPPPVWPMIQWKMAMADLVWWVKTFCLVGMFLLTESLLNGSHCFFVPPKLYLISQIVWILVAFVSSPYLLPHCPTYFIPTSTPYRINNPNGCFEPPLIDRIQRHACGTDRLDRHVHVRNAAWSHRSRAQQIDWPLPAAVDIRVTKRIASQA